MMTYLIIAELVLLMTTLLPPYSEWQLYYHKRHGGHLGHPWMGWAMLFAVSLAWPLWLAACVLAVFKGAMRV